MSYIDVHRVKIQGVEVLFARVVLYFIAFVCGITKIHERVKAVYIQFIGLAIYYSVSCEIQQLSLSTCAFSVLEN